jgi:hypothetical protein
MTSPSEAPVLAIEKLQPGESVDPTKFGPDLVRRMQEYGYVTDRNVRATGLQRLKHACRNEGLVLFLGAGVSSASGIPGWRDLLDGLLADIGSMPAAQTAGGEKAGSISQQLQTRAGIPMTAQFDLIVHDCKGPEQEREFVDRLRKGLYGQPRFSRLRMLLDAIPEDNDAKTRHDWSALRSELQKNSTLAAIGDLIIGTLGGSTRAAGIRAVLTTNVDNLLQVYVMSRSGGQRRLDTVSDASCRETPGNVPVYYLHGWLDMRERRQGGAVREPPLVFKESEYFSTIASPSSFANNTAQHFFQRGRVLFIGTSLEDLNVRRWLFNAFLGRRSAHASRLESRRVAHAGSEAYAASIRHFWLRQAIDLPKRSSEPESLPDFMEDIMRHLGVEIIWYDDHSQITSWLHDLAS